MSITGPLVDVETGCVMGINAAIRAHMEGTSFAIPINRVRDLMYDLAEGRQVQHGYLGISLATCTPEWARQNNAKADSTYPQIPEIHGALVHKVFPKTPAEKGGLRNNDIVLEINGKRVETSDQARRLIDGAEVGAVRVLPECGHYCSGHCSHPLSVGAHSESTSRKPRSHPHCKTC